MTRARDEIAVGQRAITQHAVDAFAHHVDPAVAFAHRDFDVGISARRTGAVRASGSAARACPAPRPAACLSGLGAAERAFGILDVIEDGEAAPVIGLAIERRHHRRVVRWSSRTPRRFSELPDGLRSPSIAGCPRSCAASREAAPFDDPREQPHGLQPVHHVPSIVRKIRNSVAEYCLIIWQSPSSYRPPHQLLPGWQQGGQNEQATPKRSRSSPAPRAASAPPIAERLAARRLHRHHQLCRQRRGRPKSWSRKIESAGGRAHQPRRPTSATPAAVARMFDAAEAAFGGVDVLVNNAGIMNLAPIAESDDALFDRQVAVNLKGTFNTLREAAQAAARRRPDHQLVVQRGRLAAADLRRLRRHQGGRRGDDPRPVEGAARPQHHGQRRRARADGDRAVPRRQVAGADRAARQARAAGAPRPARGHRQRGGLPRRPGRRPGSTARSLRANGGII